MSSEPENTPQIFIARQPIYDEYMNTYAYELLFRNSDANFANIEDGDKATSSVIVSAFMEIGLERLIGDKFGFINLTHGFLTGEHSIPFDKEKIILEVLEDVNVNNQLVSAVAKLRRKGYTIALDDFEYNESKADLVKQCNIIKIDLKQTTIDKLSAVVEQLKPFDKILLAEKVETEEEVEFCKNLGFKYFQGYFLSKPKVVKNATLPANKLVLLQLLAKTQNPGAEFDELESLINHDAGISYKFLKLINSAKFNLSKKVESLHQALVLLGLREIKTWIALVALSDIDIVPKEITTMTMVRARVCLGLAEKAGCDDPDIFFTIGMFSLLDVLMKTPMEVLLDALSFSETFNSALLLHDGIMGEALDCAIACEQGDWSKITFDKLTAVEINDVFVEAVEWSNEVCTQLK